jgi:GNAT superfamily N-acetyltransferase
MNLARAIACRPARFYDQADIFELTSMIWEGQDYIPRVWADWLADPGGLLLVAEGEGHAVGLGKLTDLGLGEWWLEGLRVSPAWQGQGVASHLHESLMEAWRHRGGGTVRLATGSQRLQVHHLCARLGFFQVADLVKYTWTGGSPPPPSSPRVEAEGVIRQGFAQLKESDLPRAVEWTRQESLFAGPAGLLNLGWKWAQAAPQRLREWVREGKLWLWRERGLVGLFEEEEEGMPFREVTLMMASEAERVDLLREACSLVLSLGARGLIWRVPNQPMELERAQEAGLQRASDTSLYLFEARS